MYASKGMNDSWLILILEVLYVLMEVYVVWVIIWGDWLLLVFNDVCRVILKKFFLDTFFLFS